MAEYENTQYTDEMEFEVPKKSRETVKRLWKSMGRQRIRLMIVAVSVVFYTVLSVAAPVYSAKIVDLLFMEIKAAIETGDVFRVSWEHCGTGNHDPSSYLYSDRDPVHVSELSHGQLCRAPEPGASDKDQQETFKAASFLL